MDDERSIYYKVWGGNLGIFIFSRGSVDNLDEIKNYTSIWKYTFLLNKFFIRVTISTMLSKISREKWLCSWIINIFHLFILISSSPLYTFNIIDNNYETLEIYWPCRCGCSVYWEQCSINETDHSILS